jgi:hypothetical protein
MTEPVHKSTSNTSKRSKDSGIRWDRGELCDGRKKPATKRLTPKQRKFERDQKFYDEVRQQYSDGKFNIRQISKIEERIAGFFQIQPYEKGEAYFQCLLSQAGAALYNKRKDEAGDIASIIVQYAACNSQETTKNRTAA